MDFAESAVHRMLRESVRELAADFDRDYWVDHVERKAFPREYWDALADRGWLGVAIPEEYGGEGFGMLELAMVVEELDRGGGQAAIFYTMTPVFGGITLVEHGTEAQKEAYLPDLVDGECVFALGLTEPTAGTNTLRMETTAVREGDEFVIDGQKTFISGVEVADTMILVARTSPYDPENPSHGITAFLVDDPTGRDGLATTPLDVTVPWAERQYQVTLDGVRVDQDAVLGEVDAGMDVLWSTLNTERIVTACGCIGYGLRAVDLAAEYAGDRSVFGQPIGAHQGVQHPLADGYSKVMCARSMVYEAAWRYDQGESCAAQANMGKLRASEAATEAASAALQAHGGNGFTREYEVFDLWQNVRLWQTSPVANEMAKNYIAEHVLDLPRSY
jgi:acyl-CoA dehydrogenase